MPPSAHQITAVERLVRESIRAVDALVLSALQAVFPALRQARDEARRDLRAWLGTVGDGSDKFTAGQRAQSLRALEATLERVAELKPAMAHALSQGRHAAGPLAVANLDAEVQRLSAIFGGGVPTIPQINTAAIIARGDRLLWRRHERSAARYAGAVGDDIKHLFAVGVAKGETFEQLVTRLRRLGNPAAKARAIDAGHDADAIADGLLVRHKHMADRLVRTELMHSYNVEHDEAISYANDHRPEGDEEFLRRWDAAADLVVCAWCKSLDRTVTTIKGTFAGGVSSPPLHPYCRCTVLAWLARWGDMKGETPIKGEAPKVPSKPKRAPVRPPKIPKPGPPPKGPEAPKPTPPPPPVKTPRALKGNPRAPKPLPMQREARSVAPEAAAVLEALGKGDHNAALHLLNKQFDKMSLVPSTDRNKDVRVTTEGMTGIKSHSGIDITARAYRNWQGHISLSPDVADEIKRYGAAVGTKDPTDLRAAVEEHGDALYTHRMKMSQADRAKAKATGADYGQLNGIDADSEGVKTFVHEALHGYSPLESRAYRGAGGQIEEITVETSARLISNRLFGIPIAKPSSGSYNNDLHGATNAIAEMSGATYEQAWAHLQNASVRFKRRPWKIEDHEEVVTAFSHDIANELGIRDHMTARAVLKRHLALAAAHTAGGH